MKNKGHSRLGIISFVVDKRTSGLFLSNLYFILDNICNGNVVLVGVNVDVIDNNKLSVHSVRYSNESRAIIKAIKFAYLQAFISYQLLKLRDEVDIWFFFGGGELLLMPMLAVKLLRKRSIVTLLGNIKVNSRMQNEIFSKPKLLFKEINLSLAGRIVVYSQILIKEWDLEKYRNKIVIAYEHFLDFSKFKLEKRVSERDNSIGYIGRFSEEKGALNFLKAISILSEEKYEFNFIIGGDGQQYDKIKNYIQKNNLYSEISLVGWIPHDDLPERLSRLKLLVIPSYSEGLPNIMLEAMACGTPVLATPVGSIPDIIKDGETGFLMESNSPECIAANVIRALNHPYLEDIALRARTLVEKEFAFEKTLDLWRDVLVYYDGR